MPVAFWIAHVEVTDEAAYALDPDGHVIAFARPLA